MVILGIDPALAITGYGAIQVQKNAITLVEAGVIKTSAGEAVEQRLDKIYRGVSKLITDTRPACLVLEKIYSHYRHPVTSYILGQARGVICLACAREKVPLIEYGATRVKKAIVGKGLASKGQIQRMVAGLLGIEQLPRYNDVTDALALAIAHSYIIKARVK